jgi:acyl-CoA reductase-like NAD-dependent aldehyde dehydrogenase
MVVNGVRMDVRKALQLMKGAEADEVLDVSEGEPIPEQKLASEEAVDAARAAFRREQERRNAEARAKRAKARKAK